MRCGALRPVRVIGIECVFLAFLKGPGEDLFRVYEKIILPDPPHLLEKDALGVRVADNVIGGRGVF